MRTFIRPRVPRTEFGLRSLVERIPNSFFLLALVSFLSYNLHAQKGISCYHRINISINANGTPTTLEPEDLTPMSDLSPIDTVIREDGKPLEFTCADVGKIVKVALIGAHGQACLTEVNVEAKASLQISGESIAIPEDAATFPYEDIISIHSCQQFADVSFERINLSTSDFPGCDTIQVIETKIIGTASNGSMDSIVVPIYILETTPEAPLIILKDTVEVSFSAYDPSNKLDTFDIFQVLEDDMDCIASITLTGSGYAFGGNGSEYKFNNAMTGSGYSAGTGSGLPVFENGQFIEFDCTHAGDYLLFAEVEDCCNNIALDTTVLRVDPTDVCNTRSNASLVTGPYDTPMSQVYVSWGGEEIETDEIGKFQLETSAEGPYQIELRYPDIWERELTVMDLKLIQDYILERRSLEPWQKASADLDRSASLTGRDMILLRRVIMGYKPEITKQEPWIYSLDKFENVDYQTYANVVRVHHSHKVHIYSTKLGDVDGSSVTNNAYARSPYQLRVHETKTADNIYRYDIDFSLWSDYAAGQFAIATDIGTIRHISDAQIATYLDERTIGVLHFDGMRTSAFSFEVITDGSTPRLQLSEMIHPIIFDASHQSRQPQLIQLSTTSTPSDFALIARPNPTMDRVWITLDKKAEHPSDIDVSIWDMLGRSVYQRHWQGVSPSTVFPLQISSLPSSGNYIARVKIGAEERQIHIIKN